MGIWFWRGAVTAGVCIAAALGALLFIAGLLLSVTALVVVGMVLLVAAIAGGIEGVCYELAARRAR